MIFASIIILTAVAAFTIGYCWGTLNPATETRAQEYCDALNEIVTRTPDTLSFSGVDGLAAILTYLLRKKTNTKHVIIRWSSEISRFVVGDVTDLEEYDTHY